MSFGPIENKVYEFEFGLSSNPLPFIESNKDIEILEKFVNRVVKEVMCFHKLINIEDPNFQNYRTEVTNNEDGSCTIKDKLVRVDISRKSKVVDGFLVDNETKEKKILLH